MSNEEILRKAIEKAEKNGYYFPIPSMREGYDLSMTKYVPFFIFDHGFAKAFFGERVRTYIQVKDEPATRQPAEYDWQYYLQQMVLEEDPIRYLEKHL